MPPQRNTTPRGRTLEIARGLSSENTSVAAVSNWLAQLHYNNIRRIENTYDATRPDGRTLRGVLVSHDLVLTRKREFFRIVPMGEENECRPVSIEDASREYPLRDMQSAYREQQDRWKAARRRAS